MSTLEEDLAYVRRAARLDQQAAPRPVPGQVSTEPGQVSDPLRDALGRYVMNGHIDPGLFRTDAVYHAVITLIRQAHA